MAKDLCFWSTCVSWDYINFLFYITCAEAVCTYIDCTSCTTKINLYFKNVWFPSALCVVVRFRNLAAMHWVLSANITCS